MKLSQVRILISLVLSFFERELKKPAVRKVLVETKTQIDALLEDEV